MFLLSTEPILLLHLLRSRPPARVILFIYFTNTELLFKWRVFAFLSPNVSIRFIFSMIYFLGSAVYARP